MTTDLEWEKWGRRDPYYGVLTHPRFRAAALTDDARQEFFALGRLHVEHVLQQCRAHLDADFEPRRVLDFGCGVGRLVLPFAKRGAHVVGVDVSPSMLAETRKNCDAAGLTDVELVLSDDGLSKVEGDFDLVHTCIVIQHIEVERGIRIFEALVRRIRPNGMGALQVTFAWDHHAANHGVAPLPPQNDTPPWHRRLRQLLGDRTLRTTSRPAPESAPDADPEMQMNFYNMSQLMFVLHRAGIGTVHSELTNHGGAIGAFMFFRKPAG